MILIDANLLLYAYGAASEHHAKARPWLEFVLSRAEPVGLAWVTILAFLRIGTDSRLQGRPLLMREAISIVNEWLSRPNVAVLEPGERHWSILSRLLPESQARGPLVMDAHLAALAIEHGATVATNDRDFTRFPGLGLEYPLDSA